MNVRRSPAVRRRDPLAVREAPGHVARWVRKQVIRPRYVETGCERLTLVAEDGTLLHAVRIPGPDTAIASVVLAHGITNSSRTPGVHAFAHELARWAHVVVLDLRGHGVSGGACTLGMSEPLDVAAAATAARQAAGQLPVVLVGTSLGAMACLLTAAQAPLREATGIAGVFAVSSPAYPERNKVATTRLVGWCSTAPGRLFVRTVLRTRIKSGWRELDDTVHRETAHISPAFTVIVHDGDDIYFGGDHAETIYASAREPKALWWLHGAGHGTDLLSPALAARMRAETETRLAAGG